MAMTTWPARCERCKAIAVDHLWSDPSVPIYACGSLPYGTHAGPVPEDHKHRWVNRQPCDCGAPMPDDLVRWLGSQDVNVTVPTDDELADYADIAHRMAIAWAPEPATLGGRIGLCEVMHCDATAVDGRCLAHSEPACAVCGIPISEHPDVQVCGEAP